MKKIKLSLLVCLFTTNAFCLGIDMNEAKTIKSNKVYYNVKTEEIKTSGNTEMTNAAGQRVKVNELSLSKKQSNVLANNIELWLGSHVYIKSDKITRDGEETIAKNADFTACDGCDNYGNAWDIHARTIIHDQNEKMVYFHNASFWVYDNNFPIFWLPYFEMPDPSVKYKSGLLMPSFSSTNGMGTQINLPIYINISDHHDLTTTFSYLTQENPFFQAEHRLNLHHSEFRTKGSFTHNRENENRWHLYNDDTIELGNNARAIVYIARTSDKTYLQKYDFYDYQPYLDSGAKLELFGQTSYIVADTHIFQELREPSRNQAVASGNILPNIRGTYQTKPFWHETYFSFSGDVLAISGDKVNSQRAIGEVRITSPWTLWGGNRITLSAASRYDVYNFENTEMADSTNPYTGMKTRFLPSGYVEWGLPLYSAQSDWTYIIEPRARLTIMQRTDKKNSVFAKDNDSDGRFLSDTTLFSNNRYAGYDVWENGNFVDYGMRWAAFNNNNNIEVFFGQTYDFKTDREDFYDNGFRNGFSDYVGRVAYSRQFFELVNRSRFDRINMNLTHSENSLYLGRGNNYISLGHIWDTQPIDIYSDDDKDTHEFAGGAGIQITKRISIKGSMIYNAYEHIIQRHSGGIFYEHPCYYFSLEYRRDNATREDYVGNTTYQFKFGMSIDGKHY